MNAYPLNELLRDLADKADITAVLHNVARAMDSQDWALFVSGYAPDAIGDYTNTQEEGRDAILAAAQRFLTSLDTTQHLLGDIQVAVDGDSAHSRATFIAQHVREGAAGSGKFLLGGNYDDDFKRTDSGWKITKRTIRGIWGDGDFTVLQTPVG